MFQYSRKHPFSNSFLGIKFLSNFGIRNHRIPHELRPPKLTSSIPTDQTEINRSQLCRETLLTPQKQTLDDSSTYGIKFTDESQCISNRSQAITSPQTFRNEQPRILRTHTHVLSQKGPINDHPTVHNPTLIYFLYR